MLQTQDAISATDIKKTAAVFNEKIRQQHKANYDSWPIDWLAAYIEKLQRKTITQQSAAIWQNISLAKNNGNLPGNYLLQLETQFAALASRLTAHMQKEEQHLFPFVREMAQAKELNHAVNRTALDKMEWLIALLNEEHATEKSQLKLSAGLRDHCIVTPGFNKPASALYTALAQFEQASGLHMDLQYKYLFPKIIAVKYSMA